MLVGRLVHVPSYVVCHSFVDCIAGPYHLSIKYHHVVEFGLLLSAFLCYRIGFRYIWGTHNKHSIAIGVDNI